MGKAAELSRAGLLAAAAIALAACGHNNPDVSRELNAYPASYKADILAAMHAYLNDPSGIRDAAISEPMLKTVGERTRYLVCLRFNGKLSNGTYAGAKQVAAVFLAGRFDNFADVAANKEPCGDATYAPFPELENLPR